MSLKRIFVNVLLALALALPISALETRINGEQATRLTPKSAGLEIRDSGPLGLAASASGLLDTVSRKLVSTPSPRRIERRYDSFIKRTAQKHGVSHALVKAVIKAESGFDPYAVSPAGAIGLMQIMPETARLEGIEDPADPMSNIRAGVRYLKRLLIMFRDDEALALAAYNSGPAKVKRYGGVPPYKETRAFVRRVMSYYRSYLGS